jgi:flagellar motor switch protein FliG
MSAFGAVSGARKAAIALMVLGEEGSSSVFRYLHEDEIEKVAREIATLGTVPPEVGEEVLTELSSASATSTGVTAGGIDQARRLLTKTLGPDHTRRILEKIVQSLHTSAGFASLERIHPEQLARFFLDEHPQTTALIVSHLSPGAAAQLLAQLPDELRTEVLLRLATLGDIPPDVVARVSGVIEQKLRGLAGPSRAQRGGVRAVAEIFNCLDRGIGRPALERLEAAAPDTASAIRNLMFVFDDLVQLDQTAIRELVSRADKRALTVALKGASDAVRQLVFGNMSKRAVDLMKEEMEMLGAIRLREVEKAQQEIVAIVRTLEEEGLVTLEGGGDDAFVT